MKSLIIDDDPKSHSVLKALIRESHPAIEVIQSGFAIEEGLQLIRDFKPDLVFLDIELPDGLGFDLLSNIKHNDFHVIFITAYDKYALTAIRFGALDFLVKPIEREALAVSLEKAHKLQKRKIQETQLEILRDAYEKVKQHLLPTRLAISDQKGITYLDVKEIMRLEARQVFTVFHLYNNGKQVVSSANLGKYVNLFDSYDSFVRVHRSHLLNLAYVSEFKRGDRVVVLKDGTEIPISRGFLDDFLDGMKRL